jgi:hypothetical protein
MDGHVFDINYFHVMLRKEAQERFREEIGEVFMIAFLRKASRRSFLPYFAVKKIWQ